MREENLDPDDVKYGLQDVKVCTITNAGCCSSVTWYETDTVTHGCVREGFNGASTGYVETDAVIAQLYQDELSRIAQAESQNWSYPEVHSKASDYSPKSEICKDGGEEEEEDEEEEDSVHSVEIEEGSGCVLDCEVGKRLNQMAPVPHVPKINGQLPSEDEQISDHERLLSRLQLYGLIENKVEGDGNCQFRSLSDQLYRSPNHHKFVREQVIRQISYNREMYEGYVTTPYNDYLERMKRNGEWGDHVTLQAAADSYGVRIFVITSFKDTCYIEILPHVLKSNRLICLSFWAEVHYNSIYPQVESKKKKKKKKK